MKFSELYFGDRFLAHDALWCRIDTTIARKITTSLPAYIGDPVCSFDPQDEVEFVPPHIPADNVEVKKLRNKIAAMRRHLESIVCTLGCDKGVVMLCQEGRTHYSKEHKVQVYNHVNFSPLGDALIELWEATLCVSCPAEDWEKLFDALFVSEKDNENGPHLMFRVHGDGMRQLALPEHFKEFIRMILLAEVAAQ